MSSRPTRWREQQRAGATGLSYLPSIFTLDAVALMANGKLPSVESGVPAATASWDPPAVIQIPVSLIDATHPLLIQCPVIESHLLRPHGAPEYPFVPAKRAVLLGSEQGSSPSASCQLPDAIRTSKTSSEVPGSRLPSEQTVQIAFDRH